MYGGDGFWMFADPTDSNYVYAESQGGEIGRVNRKTHDARWIRPLPRYQEKKLRFNWNTPIHISSTRNGTVYIGSQYLFGTRDFGQTWDRISPDLTTNDPSKQLQEQSGGVTVDNSAAEMHTTIYAIAESPKDPNVIWAGTDDGNLQVTRDGGKTWTNVVGNIAGLPKSAWVSYVDASHLDAGTVFATFDLHTFGDMRPYAYKSSDYGKTWKSLVAAASPVRGYAHVIRQDLVNPDLLFLGTEFGLWISLDGGTQWSRYRGGDFPSVAVRDIAIQPRDNDLVVATHGRGIWIIDDITPLRRLTPSTLAQDVVFMRARPTIQKLPASGGWANGDAAFVGNNSSDAAVITYYLKKRHIFGDMKIDVLDAAGKVVGTVPTAKRRGLSRVMWSMRLPAPRVPPAASAAFGAAYGPRLLPGTYTVRMTKDNKVYTMPIELVQDPREPYTMADRRAAFALANRISSMLSDMSFTVERINAVRSELEDRAQKLPAGDALAQRLRNASSALDAMRKKIVATKEGGMITGEERLRENLTDLYSNVVFFDGPPSQMELDRTEAIGHELSDIAAAFDAWTAKDLASLNTELAAKNLKPIVVMTRTQWDGG
jgi:photosystem II stability/assembly factor-like uncharacterized protein